MIPHSGGSFLRELIFKHVLSHDARKSNGRHPGRYGFKKLRRGVFGLFFPHRHGAQAIFQEREFSQRFKCARSVDALLRTETCRENWAAIDFCVIGKSQPINRCPAFSGAIAGIVTLRGE
jgi:hypothetical protein